MTETDANLNVLTENVSACQAGKVASTLTDAARAERAAMRRLEGTIAMWGLRPVLEAVSRWLLGKGQEPLAVQCGQLLQAIERSRHPMLYVAKTDADAGCGRELIPPEFACPVCTERDRANLIEREWGWFHCDSCGANWKPV